MKRKTWYPLDNAAKIYPPTSSLRRPGNFSFSFIMRDKVDATILDKAVNNCLTRFPTFKTKLKRGIFWYYLEENKKPFAVRPEEGDYLKFIDRRQNNDYLFKIYYSEYKITIVVFHALCDGNAGLKFLKNIVFEYLLLMGNDIKSEGVVKPVAEPESFKETEDSFIANYEKSKSKLKLEKLAFRIEGTPYDYDGQGIIVGKLDIKSVKAVAQRFNATLTEFISGVYMYNLYECYVRSSRSRNKLVRILIPLDMRRIHNSETVRNFSLFVRLSHEFKEPLTIEECIKICSEQLKTAREKDKIDEVMFANVSMEKHALMKILPLFLKDFVMNLTYNFVGERLQTGNISNIGVLELPKSVEPFVEKAIFCIASTYSCPQQTGIISYGDNMYITTTRGFKETIFERNFYRTLTSFGLTATVTSNHWESATTVKVDEKPKREKAREKKEKKRTKK